MQKYFFFALREKVTLYTVEGVGRFLWNVADYEKILRYIPEDHDANCTTLWEFRILHDSEKLGAT